MNPNACAIITPIGDGSGLEVKVFGGGRILAAMTDVGMRNIDFVHRFLRDDRLRLVRQDVATSTPASCSMTLPVEGC